MSYQKVPLIATFVSTFLAIIKIIVWIISWSVSVLSSAVDSLLDVWISMFNWFALKTAYTPFDSRFNYGKWKIEGIAVVIEGIIIIISWLFIILEAFKKIIFNEIVENIDLGIYIMILSVIVVWVLVWYLSIMYKKSWNVVIKSDLIHYKMDLLINLGVIISLIIVKFTGIYYFDFIFWLIIWIYIIKESFSLLKEWIWILLDKALEERDKIASILDEFVKKWTIKWWHDLRTRKSWPYKFVEFHFIVDPNMTIKQAHNIWDEISDHIKKLDDKFNWVIIYHPDRKNDANLVM